MIRRPPRSTRTDTLFPYTTLFRSARLGGLHEIQPRRVRARVPGGDDLDCLAIAQMRVERFELTIEPRGDAAIAEFRMHGVSAVDWRSAALQLADLAPPRDNINRIRQQADLGVVDEGHRTGTAELVEPTRYPLARVHPRHRPTRQ